MQYHAVIIGEDGMEFGYTFHADDREAANAHLEEQYPYGNVVQLEDPSDTAAREARIYQAALMEEGDWELPDDLYDDWDDDYLAENCLN